MSRNLSILTSLREIPTEGELEAANQITLLDHTTKDQPSATVSDIDEEDAERIDSETQPPTPSDAPLVKKATSSSLQQSVKRQISRQKYSKYSIDRFDHGPEVGPSTAPQIGDNPKQANYLARGTAKAKGILNRKRTLHKALDEDSVIDILYENQRGAFLFGIPMFSSASLLNFDPKPWQNAAFRTSPVDIRDAQVPDPSWDWAWKSWYVDMSRDVDEEGWEYSFSFQAPFAWHGNHPWFHSFVRRRRWLRKRVRKAATHRTKERGHELTAEYFTIHPKNLNSPSLSGSRTPSTIGLARMNYRKEEELDLSKMDVSDVGSLMRALRKASVDREKLVAVRKFIDQAPSIEIYYLSAHIPEIMALFVYQSSRRHLLGDLMQHFDGATERRESLAAHDHEDEGDLKKEHDAAASRANNLLKAVKAADEQVKKLEYWSDIKGMARNGETLLTTDESIWDPARWPGLDTSGAINEHDAFESKQHPSQPPPALHKHALHQDDQPGQQHRRHSSDETDTSGYTTAPSMAAASMKSPPGPMGSWKSPTFTERRKKSAAAESDLELEPYMTASESPESSILKNSVYHQPMDGVIEEDEMSGTETPRRAGFGRDGVEGVVEESVEDTVPDVPRAEGMDVVEPKAIDVDFGGDPNIMETH